MPASAKYKVPNADFNPRSHERSDDSFLYLVQSVLISIHAPTRGATKATGYSLTRFTIFQSTLPREERHSVSPFLYLVALISIHAPTRGATGTCIHS